VKDHRAAAHRCAIKPVAQERGEQKLWTLEVQPITFVYTPKQAMPMIASNTAINNKMKKKSPAVACREF